MMLKSKLTYRRDFAHETPGTALPEPPEPNGPVTVGTIANASGRHKEMEVKVAENVARFYRESDAPDLTLTARALGVLAVLLLAAGWVTIVDLQLELEDRGLIIPMASLYPLLDRLAAIGFIAKKDDPGSKGKGRPKAFYAITHTGRCAVSLGEAVAKSLMQERAEADV